MYTKLEDPGSSNFVYIFEGDQVYYAKENQDANVYFAFLKFCLFKSLTPM